MMKSVALVRIKWVILLEHIVYLNTCLAITLVSFNVLLEYIVYLNCIKAISSSGIPIVLLEHIMYLK